MGIFIISVKKLTTSQMGCHFDLGHVWEHLLPLNDDIMMVTCFCCVYIFILVVFLGCYAVTIPCLLSCVITSHCFRNYKLCTN